MILQNNVTPQSQTTENQIVITSQSNNLQNKNTTFPTFPHKIPKKRDCIPYEWIIATPQYQTILQNKSFIFTKISMNPVNKKNKLSKSNYLKTKQHNVIIFILSQTKQNKIHKKALVSSHSLKTQTKPSNNTIIKIFQTLLMQNKTLSETM